MESIKVVKALDKTGPGENGENYEFLWKSFSGAVGSPFHAAEESTLRRLLKAMTGNSTTAETTRRYPLAWMLLSTTFQRMPLLALAKSLADRRFVNILQQSLKELAQSTDNAETPVQAGKRKRADPTKFELASLKTTESRLEATQALCHALKLLLGKLDTGGDGSAQAKNGSEHLKSIFSVPADEAVKVVSPLLLLGSLALESDDVAQIEGLEGWSEIISTIWDLHLHNELDASLQVAPLLFEPASTVLAKLETLTDGCDIPGEVRARWSSDIRSLLHKTLAQPARAAFIKDGSFKIVEITLESNNDRLDVAIPALYNLITSSLTPESKRQRGERAWLQKIFKSLVEAAEGLPNSTAILRSLLQRADECSTPVEVDYLRQISRGHALKSSATDWDIISLAVSCDPDLFQVTDEAKQLLADVCERVRNEGKSKKVTPEVLDTVIDGIFKGFKTSRDVPGFLKLWYAQLVALKEAKSWSQSPWLRFGRSASSATSSFKAEHELSLSQFDNALNAIVSDNPDEVAPVVFGVFLDTITQSFDTDVFRDAFAERLFDLAQKLDDSSSQLAALKWRLTARAISWLDHEKKVQAWKTVEKPISKILRKSKVETAACFEAFKCTSQIWTAMRPDEETTKEPATLIESFSARLSTFIADKGLSEATLSEVYELGSDRDLDENPSANHYIAWCSRVLSPLVHLRFGTENVDIMVPRLAGLLRGYDLDASHDAWNSILANDQTWKDEAVALKTVDQLIAGLGESNEKSKSSKKWAPEYRKQIELLTNIPLEAMSRAQREKIMTVLATFTAKLERSAKNVTSADWICYLGLVSKVMSESTFYEGMHFKDLSSMADALTAFASKQSSDDRSYLQFMQKFDQVATATLAQMLEAKDRTVEYFGGASTWISETGKVKKSGDVVPLRMTLLKAIIGQLGRSTRSTEVSELEALQAEARKALSSNMTTVISAFGSEDTLFAQASQECIFEMYAAWDAAQALDATDFAGSKLKLKEADGVKLDKDSFEAAKSGSLRGWVVQHLLRSYLPQIVAVSLPTNLSYPQQMPSRVCQVVIERFTSSLMTGARTRQKVDFVEAFLDTITKDGDSHVGQLLMLEHVIVSLISEHDNAADKTPAPVMVEVYGAIVNTLSQVKNSSDGNRICEILQVILDSAPQALSQWNLELTLQHITTGCMARQTSEKVPFQAYCKLIGTILKKHRHRLEGHFHLLVATLESLLVTLVTIGRRLPEATRYAVNKLNAAAYRRLITMICEPTSGSVARLHQHSALDTAVDIAKKSAGRYMYLVLIRYIKLQLDTEVAKEIQDAFEPAINSILNITSSDGRKILHDLMDANGRAIGRELFRKYTKFGKWTGI